MTRDEILQRQKLRKLIEGKSIIYKDKHENDIECLFY